MFAACILSGGFMCGVWRHALIGDSKLAMNKCHLCFNSVIDLGPFDGVHTLLFAL